MSLHYLGKCWNAKIASFLLHSVLVHWVMLQTILEQLLRKKGRWVFCCVLHCRSWTVLNAISISALYCWKIKLRLMTCFIASNIPQGSVLGPLFFIMYTTPLSTLISSLSLNHYLYAYDTQLFFSCHPYDNDSNITHLQNALQQISSWMTVNL